MYFAFLSLGLIKNQTFCLKRILVIGGLGLTSVELIALDGHTEDLCSIPNIPIQDDFALGHGGILDGRPLVCGGDGLRACYTYHAEEGEWVESEFPFQHRGGSGVQVRGSFVMCMLE